MLRTATPRHPDDVRRRVGELAERGVAEIVFPPCGPGVRGELERFLDAVSPT